eukprot:2265055-Pleurochrysis_carterae.AAC.4
MRAATYPLCETRYPRYPQAGDENFRGAVRYNMSVRPSIGSKRQRAYYQLKVAASCLRIRVGASVPTSILAKHLCDTFQVNIRGRVLTLWPSGARSQAWVHAWRLCVRETGGG